MKRILGADLTDGTDGCQRILGADLADVGGWERMGNGWLSADFGNGFNGWRGWARMERMAVSGFWERI